MKHDREDRVARRRERLLQKISESADLPALGSSVSRVVQMASSDDKAVRNLANFILSDVALTQKILRMSNTVAYRTSSGMPVTTVSKAIFLLGFDTVKTSALAMLLVEGLSKQHANSIRNELSYALRASVFGRELARRSQYPDAEEAAIASLFKNIGRLLVASHDHQLYTEITRLVEGGKHTPVQASMELLGCSFESLADGVLREWNIPEPIVQALGAPPVGVLKPARNKQEWMAQVAAFSAMAAAQLLRTRGPEFDVAMKAILTRFGVALNFDQPKLDQLFGSVAQEMRDLAASTALPLDSGEGNAALADSQEVEASAFLPDPANPELPNELLLDMGSDAKPPEVTERHASGKPVNSRDLLLAGVQDTTQMLVSGRCKVNDLMLLVLETLCNSMGFRFAAVCLKDMNSQYFRARITMGENHAARQAGFAFPVTATRDLFYLAMDNNADLMISDASVPKIRDLLPAWHRKLLPDTRSFILLPLVVQQKPVGLFYADRMRPAPEGVQPDETALIKTLKGQVLTALNAAR
jgi:HD-like signal output (HDOD) protein